MTFIDLIHANPNLAVAALAAAWHKATEQASRIKPPKSED